MEPKIGRSGGTNKGSVVEKRGPLPEEGAGSCMKSADHSVGGTFFAFERTKAKLRLGSELNEAACW
jgi:hypothetical protein